MRWRVAGTIGIVWLGASLASEAGNPTPPPVESPRFSFSRPAVPVTARRPPHRSSKHRFIPGVLAYPDIVWIVQDEPPVATTDGPREPEAPAPASAAPPVAEPKVLFPPAPSVPARPGERTIVIQRGDQVEVQTFPLGRKD